LCAFPRSAIFWRHQRKQILANGLDHVLAEERSAVLILTGNR
jgi:hypothetical protein